MREPRWSSCLKFVVSRSFIAVLLAITATNAAAQTQTLVYDEFSGPNWSNFAGHTPNVNVMGGPWSIVGSPSLMLISDAVVATNYSASNIHATIDSGAADATILIWWYASNYSNTPTGGVVFRYVDSTNYYVAHFWQELVYLSKMTPNGLVHIGYAGAGYPYGAWHSLEVRAVGPTINVYWDNYHRIQATDSTNQAATRHGVWWWNQYDYQSAIGSFRVTGTPVPPVASATASPNPLQLPVNGSKVITATGFSATGTAIPTARFTWTTSNAAVASIQSTTDNTAKIVGSAVGTASITATAQSGVTVTIPVTVTSTLRRCMCLRPICRLERCQPRATPARRERHGRSVDPGRGRVDHSLRGGCARHQPGAGALARDD